MGKTDDRYIVPGLARGMEVLAAFSPSRKSLSLAELAGVLGTTRSALFRVTYTLTSLGFLVQDASRERFSLGPAVLRLGVGYLATRSLVEAALPLLEGLRDRTGWSAHLGVLEGRELVYLLRLPTPGRLSIVHVGSRLPAQATAMGRVLLAGLDAAALGALYRHAPPRGGMAMLLGQVLRDAKQGHVLHRGDFESGMASIAAPVRDASGIVAALSVTAPLAEAGDPPVPTVLDTARALSAALGHGAPRHATFADRGVTPPPDPAAASPRRVAASPRRATTSPPPANPSSLRATTSPSHAITSHPPATASSRGVTSSQRAAPSPRRMAASPAGAATLPADEPD